MADEFSGFTAVPVDSGERPEMQWTGSYLIVLAALVVYLLWKHG